MPIKGNRIEDEGIREPKLRHQISGPNQHMAVWFDDFMADALDETYWTSGGTTGSFATPSTNTVGGIVQGQTTAASTKTATLTWDEGVFSTAYPFGMEFRLKLDVITTAAWRGGFQQDSNDYALFTFDTDTDADNIYCSLQTAGGGDVSADSGSDLVADTYNTYRIEMYDSTNYYIRYYINDHLVEDSANFPSTQAIGSSTTFVPYFYLDNSTSSNQRLLSIDYVRVWQLRDKASYSYDLV